jgi:hypothetical protein
MLKKLQLAAYQQTISKCSIFYVERGLITEAARIALARMMGRHKPGSLDHRGKGKINHTGLVI